MTRRRNMRPYRHALARRLRSGVMNRTSVDSSSRPTCRYTPVSESSAERLLQRWRPYDCRRLSPRELRIEALVAGAFVGVAVLLQVMVAPGRDYDPGVA